MNFGKRPAWTKFETIAHTIEAIKKINQEKAAISATSILYQINDNQPTHGPMKVRLKFTLGDKILRKTDCYQSSCTIVNIRNSEHYVTNIENFIIKNSEICQKYRKKMNYAFTLLRSLGERASNYGTIKAFVGTTSPHQGIPNDQTGVVVNILYFRISIERQRWTVILFSNSNHNHALSSI